MANIVANDLMQSNRLKSMAIPHKNKKLNTQLLRVKLFRVAEIK